MLRTIWTAVGGGGEDEGCDLGSAAGLCGASNSKPRCI